MCGHADECIQVNVDEVNVVDASIVWQRMCSPIGAVVVDSGVGYAHRGVGGDRAVDSSHAIAR